MRRTLHFIRRFLLIAIFAVISSSLFAQGINTFEVVWERTTSNENRPDWFSTGDEEDNSHKGTERGIAYSWIDEYVYVASRANGIPLVKIVNPETGADEGELLNDGLFDESINEYTVYPLNYVQVSDDGQVIASNLALSTGENIEESNDDGTTQMKVNAWRVWKWEYPTSLPTKYLEYNKGGYRLGDHFTVVGELSGDAFIYAVPNDRALALRWTVTDGIIDPEPEQITLGGILTAGTNPRVAAFDADPASNFYVSGKGFLPTYFKPDGTNLTQIALTDATFPEGYSAHDGKVFELNDRKYMAMYYTSATSGQAIIIDITKGGENVTDDDVYGITPSLGEPRSTSYGAGSVDAAVIDDVVNVFVCTPDVGIACFKATGLTVLSDITAITGEGVEFTNYPNPVREQTTLSYELPSAYRGAVSVKIYNTNGKLVNEFNEAAYNGKKEIQFDAGELAAGMYFCRLTAGKYSAVRKITVVR